MGLGFGADISERQAELFGHESALGNGTGGYAGYGLSLGILLGNDAAQFELDESAESGIGQSLAVVAIKRGLPSAGPRKGLLGLQLDGFYVQKLLGKDFL